jgi:uncharacterized protein (DUF433 family)
VRSLIDYLEAGESLDEFLGQFPSVKREQANGALQLAPGVRSEPDQDDGTNEESNK